MNKKVTIQDIADELGISRNTVSKAMNNSEGIADATKELILQKAMEMGYKQFSYVSTLSNISRRNEESREVTQGYAGEIALLTTVFLNQSHFASLMLDFVAFGFVICFTKQMPKPRLQPGAHEPSCP